MSFVSGSASHTACSAMQTSEQGEILLCLSAAPILQTCSAKPIYCNPVLLKGVNPQSAMAGRPQLLPKCPLETSHLFWRMLGCQVSHDPCARVLYMSSSSYGYQQLHMLEKQQLLTAKVKHSCLEPLVAILGNNRGVKEALRGQTQSRRVPAIDIVAKSLENKKFNF